MSYAHDFGHDIPPDDWDPPRRKRGTSYRSNFVSYRSNVTKMYEELVVETEKAILIRFKEGKAWLPKSKITVVTNSKTVNLPVWLRMNLTYILD